VALPLRLGLHRLRLNQHLRQVSRWCRRLRTGAPRTRWKRRWCHRTEQLAIPRRCFRIRWRPTAAGWTWRATAGAGNPPSWWPTRGGSRTLTVVIGFTRIAVGIGSRIIRGAGLPSITGTGSAIPDLDGAGFRVIRGALPGFRGGTTTTIAVGRRFRPGRTSSPGPDHYHFVAWNHFHDRQLQAHRLPPQVADRVYDHSTIATRVSGDGHTTINNALPVSRVVAATGRPVHTVALREATQPVVAGGRAERFDTDNRSLAVYRARPDLAAHRASVTDGLQTGRPVPAQAPAWTARSTGSPGSAPESNSRPGVRQNASLILRGAQSSAMRETAPPSSLVVVGSSAARQESAPSQPPAPSAQSAQSAMNSATPSSRARPSSNPYDRTMIPEAGTATSQGSRGDWRGTVTSSPSPSWFNGNGSRPIGVAASVGGGTGGQSRNYSAVPWSSGTEVTRPTATPNYVPQRTYAAPASSAPAYSPPARAESHTPPAVNSRPAPAAAPAAPATAAASSSSARGGSPR
jgi:hypothetical protein